ncbi:MAG TPA: hypothetical protein H9903_18895 [Candidatus Aquabacterium excrementipullorum]|nr:hypothetical protein [Candidatus Aquabacterium excrementipullorum]
MKSREELVKDLTGDVIRSISPEEEFLLDEFDPKVRMDGQAAKGPRGLGAEVALGLLLPYVYRFFEKAVDRCVAKAADSAADALLKWLRESTSLADPAALKVVEHELQQAGLDESRAAAVAPAVLKALAEHRSILAAPK